MKLRGSNKKHDPGEPSRGFKRCIRSMCNTANGVYKRTLEQACVSQDALENKVLLLIMLVLATQALLHARTQLKNLMGVAEQPPNTPTATDSDGHEGKEQASIATTSTTSPESSVGKDAQIKQINITEVLDQSEIWLNRVELLQSLLGAYVPVSLDDVVDNGTAEHLRDRLIADERYSMAVYTCTKCKVCKLQIKPPSAVSIPQSSYFFS